MGAEEKKPAKRTEKKPERKLKLDSPSSPSALSSKAVDGVTPENIESTNRLYRTLKYVVTILAFVTRFYKIHHPSQVVFDEVHFGKFASHYLEHEYYFDVHPPLGKLLFAAVGYLLGYNGKFKFDQIGDSYLENNVPYILYRAMPATLGSLTVPIIFSILQNCHFSPWACFLGASLMLFDAAQITEERLILLDSSLIFFCLLSVYSYVKFRNERHKPFSARWYGWLLATGVSLSSVISIKYVGFFSFLMIGSAVIADLYNLLDVNNKPKERVISLRLFGKHFFTRFIALVIIPFLLYLFWFFVHFKVLYNSGPGDQFMSPEFQATLNANPITKEAYDIRYYDIVSIRSVPAGTFLHSHPERYPTQYEDGRISSSGQQVTGYSHEDLNVFWQIVPAEEPDGVDLSKEVIMGSPKVMLKHVATNSFLMTHDVASPSYPTNEEFTTAPYEIAMTERRDDCTFIIDFVSGGPVARTRLSHFRLKHFTTKVSMWLAPNKLPDWGFEQFEINGNKQMTAPGTTWTFGSIDGVTDPDDIAKRKTIGLSEAEPKRAFWTDYMELQGTMFYTNARLTSTHPYMSAPWTWPLMTRGISFWNNDENTEQIYLVGNHVAWFTVDAAILLMVAVLIVSQLTALRNYEWLSSFATQKLNKTLLWFLGGYLFHYVPFFFMGRQLFLHHYLPAEALGCLLVGGLADLIVGAVDEPLDRFKKNTAMMVVAISLFVLTAAHFVYFAPLCYGTPLTPDQITQREWFNIELQNNRVVRT